MKKIIGIVFIGLTAAGGWVTSRTLLRDPEPAPASAGPIAPATQPAGVGEPSSPPPPLKDELAWKAFQQLVQEFEK